MKRRSLALLLCALMVLPFFPAGARAANPVCLALGDSITTGYAPPDDSGAAQTVDSPFAGQVSAAQGCDLLNFGVNGETTAALLQRLGEIRTEIAAADVITITIGGNDLMNALYQHLTDAYNLSHPDGGITLEKMKAALQDPSQLQSRLLLLSVMGYIGEFGTSAAKAEALDVFESNLGKIMDTIRADNASAVVVIATQYNPYSHITEPSVQSIVDVFEAGVVDLNARISAVAAAKGAAVADVYTAFQSAGTRLTNAYVNSLSDLNVDFHPTQEGHDLIARVMTAALNAQRHSTHSPQAGWAAVTADTGTLTTGSWYLADDVTANGDISVCGTVTLCLNGNVLNLNGHGIRVGSGASLTLCDCGSGAEHRFAVGQDGLWTLAEENGSEILTGGVVTGGKGGVSVSGGSFMMMGGTLAGNSARFGGGVSVSGGSFVMTGGRITGNTAEQGGGVFAAGSFALAGNPVVTGNRANGAQSNVYLDSERVISVTGALEKSAEIGISMHTPGVFTDGWSRTMAGKAPAEYFFSEDEEYNVLPDGQEAGLGTGLPFADVAGDAWYAEAVEYVYRRGLMVGYGTFDPESTLTRAQLCQIVFNMEQNPAAEGESPFADVADGSWYFSAVLWAGTHGIVNGFGDGRFGPEEPVTREELACILYRYAESRGCDVSAFEDTDLSPYRDAEQIGGYAVSAMQWACGAGIMEGSDGILAPRHSATRAEAAAMLMRFAQKTAQ